jgi:hypothetical protein
VSPTQQRIEGPLTDPPVAPASKRSVWRFTLIAIPTVVAVASTAVLGYFLLSQHWQPQAQLQQPQQQVAQTPPQQPQPHSQAPAQQPAQQPPPQRQAQTQVEEPDPPVPNPLPSVPNDDKLLILINSAVLALNQANFTGNYTVLRDMAAPGFKRINSPERLAQIFANLRKRNLDLSPVVLFQPKLYQRPQVSDKGMLRITGFFPTSPERINFDVIFQPVRGQWRLFGISVKTAPAPQPAAAQTQQVAPDQASAPAKPAKAEVVKPAASTKKPAAKPKPTAESEEPAQVDVRDRIDNPPAPPPAEKPKPKNSIWNPFGR